MDVILLIAAVAPAIVLIVMMYRADTADKEPMRLLALVFGLGAAAAIPISICEMIAEPIIGSIFDSDSALYLVVETTIGVALIEEVFKLLAAVVPTWKNDAFNYVFDGIMYCAMAALGYAALENILYVFDGGLGTALVRAVMSVPSHMVDGIFMGLFVGYAKYYKYHGTKGQVRGCFVLALVVPIIEHGIFDALASTDSDLTDVGLIALLVVEYVAAFAIVQKKRGKNDVLILESTVPAAESVAEPTAEQPAAQPAEERKPSFCRECGNELPSSGSYCTSCGAKFRD